MSVSTHRDTRAGAAVYSSFVLKLYDLWVLGFSNRYAWRCPTGKVLLPFYRRHAGQRHLDVGVGTGYYLANAGFGADQEISLLDLNETSLRVAAQRLGRAPAAAFTADAMQPGAALAGRRYDSIALFYLLHCMPGTMQRKASVFEGLKHHLNEGGVLYGATILGDSVPHNGIGRALMNAYNRKGIFGNRHDTAEGLNRALEQHFADVEVTMCGRVALFVARAPLFSC